MSEKKELALEQLPKDAEKLQQTVADGKMLVLRSKDEFIYMVDGGRDYRMFNHTAGQYRAGRRLHPKTDKDHELFAGAAKAVDMAFAVTFDPAMDLPSVMYNAEEAILEAYPMVGEEEKLDFSTYNQPIEEQ